MSVSLTHRFVSEYADGVDDTLVRPSNWDDQHTLIALPNSLLVFDGSGSPTELGGSLPGRMLLDQGVLLPPTFKSMFGDATLSGNGQIAVASIGGVAPGATYGLGVGPGLASAGGRLEVAPSGVATGTYGGSSAIPIVTVGADGRVTSMSTAGISIPTPGGSSGQIQYNNSGSFGGLTVSGDGVLNTGTGALTVTKTNGVLFAASATTDTTNASNISSGTLPDARLSNIIAAAGPIGSGTLAPVITYDAHGRLTAVTTATITPAAGSITGGQPLTVANDNNVTLTLGGSATTALLAGASITAGWAGTLAANRLNVNVVQSVANDVNLTGTIGSQTLTLVWSGTLAAARLNSSVVQGITNDTNVTGTISAQNLTLGWTGILDASRGGTSNGFFAVSGPASTAKTFTFPNASATVLTTNAAVTVAQGGTGLATLTAHAVILGEGTGNVAFAAVGTSGRVLIDQGASSDPAFTAISGAATLASTGVLSLASTAVTPGTYGSSTTVGQFTVGADGRITFATSVGIAGGGGGVAPGGTSGQIQFNSAGSFGGFAVSGDGTLNTSTGALSVAKTGGVAFGALATLGVGTGLASSGGNLNIANTVSAAGPIGSATVAPIITYNAQGQLTTVTSATITPAAGSITGAAALTASNDTNVTLTLGGTPLTALLVAASLTLGWTGTLAAARLNSNVVQGVTNDTNITGIITAQNLTLAWSGQLAPARGGTGSGTAFTAGSVVFAGASGVYAQANANLFWDNVNARLGINTGSSVYSDFEVVALNDAGGYPRNITATQYSASASGALYIGRKARGTQSSPSAVLLNDTLVNMGGAGFGATVWSGGLMGSFRAFALENWSDTAQGTGVAFLTTATGGTTSAEKMRLDGAGNLGIGTTTASHLLEVNGTIANNNSATLGPAASQFLLNSAGTTYTNFQFEWRPTFSSTAGNSGGHIVIPQLGTLTDATKFQQCYTSQIGQVTAIPSGTKGAFVGFECNLSTNQATADVSGAGVSGHMFGGTLINNGAAHYDMIDVTMIINGAAPATGIDLNMSINNASAAALGLYVGSTGSNTALAGVYVDNLANYSQGAIVVEGAGAGGNAFLVYNVGTPIVVVDYLGNFTLNNLSVTSATAVSGFSGALTVTGGAGISGGLNVQGEIFSANSVVSQSNTPSTGVYVTNTTHQVGGLRGTASGNDNGGLFLSVGGTANVVLQASGTSYLTGGALGIGTTTPGWTLEVNGTVSIDTGLRLAPGANVGGASWSTLQADYSLNVGASIFLWNYTSGGGELDLFINRDGGGVGGLNVYDFPTVSGTPTLLSQTNTSGLYVPATTASSSVTTGAIVTLGGAGIGGVLNVGGFAGFGRTAGARPVDIQGTTTASTGGSSARVIGYQASYEVANQAGTVDWYFGVNDADSNKLYIGRGYGPNQGISPAFAIDTSGIVYANNFSVNSGGGTPLSEATYGGANDSSVSNAFVSAYNLAANNLGATLFVGWNGTGNTGFGAPQGTCNALIVSSIKANYTTTTVKGEANGIWVNCFSGIHGEGSYTGNGDASAIEGEVRQGGDFGFGVYMEAVSSGYSGVTRTYGCRVQIGISDISAASGFHTVGFVANNEVGGATQTGPAYFAANDGGSWSFAVLTSAGGYLSMVGVAGNTSDPAVKHNKRRLRDTLADHGLTGMDVVNGIDPTTFRWNDESLGRRLQYGFLACDDEGIHGVREFFDDRGLDFAGHVVLHDGRQALEKDQMYPAAWLALQELDQRVAALETRH